MAFHTATKIIVLIFMCFYGICLLFYLRGKIQLQKCVYIEQIHFYKVIIHNYLHRPNSQKHTYARFSFSFYFRQDLFCFESNFWQRDEKRI